MGNPGRQGVRRHDLGRFLSPRQGAARQAGPRGAARTRTRSSGRGSSGSRSPTGATASTSNPALRRRRRLADGRGPRGARGRPGTEETGAAPKAGGPQAEGGRLRRVARVPGRARAPSSRTRGRTSCGRARTISSATGCRRRSRRATSSSTSTSSSRRHSRPATSSSRSTRTAAGSERLRHERRRDLPPVRGDLHAPVRPPRGLPEEVPRGRGRRRDGRDPLRGRDRASASRRRRLVALAGRRPDAASEAPTRARRRSRSRASAFLFYDIPLSVLVFLAWSVGESIARERWGDRLASFDAILRRDPVNATVGGSLLLGRSSRRPPSPRRRSSPARRSS